MSTWVGRTGHRVWLGTLHCHRTSIFPELVSVCHPPTLPSRRNEKKHDQRIGFCNIYMLKTFFFFSFCWKSRVCPCPLNSHTLSFQLEFSMVLVPIAIQFFSLSFKFASVYVVLCKCIFLNLNFTLETWRQRCKWQCPVQSELCIITFKAELFIVSSSVL